jgi:hypothetical protein
MTSMASILARLERIEHIDRTTGIWVRTWSGEIVWDD